MASTESVREYWEQRPCGTDEDPYPEGSAEYFDWLARVRYEREPFIAQYARFEEWKDRDVLEIGVGAGTDAERFARTGARFTGIDLTEHGVELARRRFQIGSLDGRLERADAEKLPFADGSFDFVYSWGVIHHSADTATAAREMMRVCRKGGRISCMVYSRTSLYALQGKIVYGWLKGRPRRPIDEIAAEHFESPGTRLYDEESLRALFPDLTDVKVSREVTPYDARIGRRRFLPAALRRLIPRHLGYFMILEGVKR
jgi:ubiquinone/menaquinone biosynthesis C-methylase UbiE